MVRADKPMRVDAFIAQSPIEVFRYTRSGAVCWIRSAAGQCHAEMPRSVSVTRELLAVVGADDRRQHPALADFAGQTRQALSADGALRYHNNGLVGGINA